MARRLPRGLHGIPAELIVQNQRERIMAATAQISAERGYVGTTVREIVARAGVSSATFYREFDNREECVTATFWELHRRLMGEIDVACKKLTVPGPPRPRLALRRSLEIFASDPAAARLLTLEILATGTRGARTQHEAIALTAEGLGLGGTAGRGVVAMITTLVAERVVAAEAEAIPAIETELEGILRAYGQSG